MTVDALEALELADRLDYHGGRVFGVGLLAATAALRGDAARATQLWAAIEHEDAGFPLGGWRRHRHDCEAIIRRRTASHRQPVAGQSTSIDLDAAVRLALDVSRR